MPNKRSHSIIKRSHRDVEHWNKRVNRMMEFLRSFPVFQGPERTPTEVRDERWLRRMTYELAGIRHALFIARFGTILSGGSGTGKTLVLLMMMKTILEAEIAQARHELIPWDEMRFNFICYTPKNDDFYWPLRVWCDRYGIPVRSTNPFRRGGYAWWPFLKDITGFASLEQAVRSLIKEDEKENNRYFRDASRLVLRGVIMSIKNTHPDIINFRILVLICQSLFLLHQVLHRTPETRCLLSLINQEQQGPTAGNVYTTLLAAMNDLEIAAAELDDIP